VEKNAKGINNSKANLGNIGTDILGVVSHFQRENKGEFSKILPIMKIFSKMLPTQIIFSKMLPIFKIFAKMLPVKPVHLLGCHHLPTSFHFKRYEARFEITFSSSTI
jgi:hypothetical protein